MAGGGGRETGESPRAWSAREIARRNEAEAGRPLSPVMKTAATACELAHGASARRRGREPDQRSTSVAKRSD